VKCYLREHCNYTFLTLQANMPITLASVNKILIQKWHNRMMWWIDAYGDGLNAKDAQLHIQTFSSEKYRLHHRVPEWCSVYRSFGISKISQVESFYSFRVQVLYVRGM
jgi:hypothetical protein